jgi:hypothetical protein
MIDSCIRQVIDGICLSNSICVDWFWIGLLDLQLRGEVIKVLCSRYKNDTFKDLPK